MSKYYVALLIAAVAFSSFLLPVGANGSQCDPPKIVKITPDTATVNAPFQLIVDGSGFADGAVIHIQGHAISTLFVSPYRVTSYGNIKFSAPSKFYVTVTNPPPCVLTSNAVLLTIVEGLPDNQQKGPGTLVVIKKTVGGDDSFSYYLGGASIRFSFSILTLNGGGYEEKFLPAGTYDLSETITQGWKFESVSCDKTLDSQVVDNKGVMTITGIVINPTEVTTCTFKNVKTIGGPGGGQSPQLPTGQPLIPAPPSPIPQPTGRLKIVKQTTGGDGLFSYDIFSQTVLDAKIIKTTKGKGSTEEIALPSGNYTITEFLPDDGWKFDSVSCDNEFTPGTSNGAQVTMSALVKPEKLTTCTFKNIRKGSLIIEKYAKGGDGLFNYTIFPTFSNVEIVAVNGKGSSEKIFLDPGTYNIIEFIPNGWKWEKVECDQKYTDGTSDGKEVEMGTTIIAGKITTCKFLNAKTASLTINKEAIGGNGSFKFLILSIGGVNLAAPAAQFSIVTTNGSGSYAVNGVTPGTYSVAESLPTGWKQIYNNCSVITINQGQDIICDVINSYSSSPSNKGYLNIVKNANGGDDNFDFSLGVYPISITTNGGTGSVTKELTSGEYNIFETLSGNWKFDSASCTYPNVDGQGSQSVGNEVNEGITDVKVLVGTTTTCVFRDSLKTEDEAPSPNQSPSPNPDPNPSPNPIPSPNPSPNPIPSPSVPRGIFKGGKSPTGISNFSSNPSSGESE